MRRLVRAALPAAGLVLALGLPAAVSLAASPTSPVAEWRFDAGAGPTAADSTGHGHTGTLQPGATWTTSGAAQGTGAIALDGASGAVRIPTDASLRPTAQMSVIGWVRGTDRPESGLASIVAQGDRGCSTATWALVYTGGGIAFQWAAADGSPLATYTGRDIYDGQWHHVAATFDSTSTAVPIYVDGRRYLGSTGTANGSLQYDLPDQTSSDLFIGVAPNCPYWSSFEGNVDHVRVYDRVLTPDEIMADIPDYATTTTVSAYQTSPYAESTMGYDAVVSPTPPGGQVQFYLSRDGGPELHVGNPPVSEDGHASVNIHNGQNILPGAYVLRAEFMGYGPAQPSVSSSTAFTVLPIPTSVAVTAPENVHLPAAPIRLQALTGWGAGTGRTGEPGGTVTFFDVTGGGRVELGSATVTLDCCVMYQPMMAHFDAPGRLPGTYAFEARYDGSATVGQSTSTVSVTVAKAPSQVTLQGYPPTIQANHEVVFTARGQVMTASGWAPPTGGTLTLTDADLDVVLATGPADRDLIVSSTTFGLGVHHLTASYGNTDQHLASTSAPFTLTVVADQVDAVGVGLSYTTFYPVVDGYRDTLTVKGDRLEPASVSIRIYSPTNKLVRAATIPSAALPYAYAWDGRTSTKVVLATGKYRVVQTLTDALGTSRVVTSYVNLSPKKLVYKTATLYVNGGSYKASGRWGVGKVVRYSSTKVVIRGGVATTSGSTGWAGVGYQFTLPSAVVYKSLSAGVYGSSGVPPATVGVWDFTACPYSSTAGWNEACFHRWRTMGTKLTWYSLTASPTIDRYGHAVRVMVGVEIGQATITKVRLIVKYGVLQ